MSRVAAVTDISSSKTPRHRRRTAGTLVALIGASVAVVVIFMPGIDGLRAGAAEGRRAITYSALTNGARLTYSTSDGGLVYVLHTWFDAQLMDHGSHAMP